MFNDTVKITGVVTLTLMGPDGSVKDTRVENLVVTAGKNWIASRMASAAAAVMGWLAVGTGTTAAAIGDTALQTELARQATDVSGGTASGNTVTYTTTMAAGVGTGAITEAGIFNASSVGTLLAHVVFSVVNKGAADSLAISWVVTAS